METKQQQRRPQGQSPKSEINLRLLNFNENSIKKLTTFNYQKVSKYF